MKKQTVTFEMTVKQVKEVDKLVRKLKKTKARMSRSELIRAAITNYLIQWEEEGK